MHMVYNKQYILAILHDGSPVREINGTVHLPFSSEYKVRLKNKSYKRAKAKVWIDGRKISNIGDFILHPNETLDLERFLDQSMDQGNKFKFVPLSDGRVNDPTDHQNGLIKVEFYPETDPFFINKSVTDWYYINNLTVNPLLPLGGGVTYSSSGMAPVSHTFTNNYVQSDITSSLCSTQSEAGATVEGGLSNQSFVNGADFETEILPVTLTLRVKGLKRDKYSIPTISTQEKKTKVRFCSSCGKKRSRASHRYCPTCSVQY